MSFLISNFLYTKILVHCDFLKNFPEDNIYHYRRHKKKTNPNQVLENFCLLYVFSERYGLFLVSKTIPFQHSTIWLKNSMWILSRMKLWFLRGLGEQTFPQKFVSFSFVKYKKYLLQEKFSCIKITRKFSQNMKIRLLRRLSCSFCKTAFFEFENKTQKSDILIKRNNFSCAEISFLNQEKFPYRRSKNILLPRKELSGFKRHFLSFLHLRKILQCRSGADSKQPLNNK